MTRFILTFLLVIHPGQSVSAQEMAVPLHVQYTLFMKIISYDRSLMANNPEEIVLGIAYQSRSRISRNTKDEMLDIIDSMDMSDIEGRRISFSLIDMTNEDIAEALVAKQIDVLYLAPVRAVDIEQVSRICREQKVLSLTGVIDYCTRGLSVTIGQKGEKPEIIINLQASKSENSDFSSQLLKLARIL